MRDANYALVMRGETGRTGLCQAPDPQTLRNYGLRVARSCERAGVLLLLNPEGHAVEWFDVWSQRWCASV